jgi:hypothetical protein
VRTRRSFADIKAMTTWAAPIGEPPGLAQPPRRDAFGFAAGSPSLAAGDVSVRATAIGRPADRPVGGAGAPPRCSRERSRIPFCGRDRDDQSSLDLLWKARGGEKRVPHSSDRRLIDFVCGHDTGPVTLTEGLKFVGSCPFSLVCEPTTRGAGMLRAARGSESRGTGACGASPSQSVSLMTSRPSLRRSQRIRVATAAAPAGKRDDHASDESASAAALPLPCKDAGGRGGRAAR